MSLPALAGGRTFGTLDAYAARRDAFHDADQALGTVLGSHAAAALEHAHAQDRADYLAKMLGLNRSIGTATGILMVRRRWSESQAFEAMAFRGDLALRPGQPDPDRRRRRRDHPHRGLGGRVR
jgi:GAF domain-containing protein